MTRDATGRVIIHPGEFFVSCRSLVVSTLLGSCVSACLYDPVNNVFGINHFLVSARPNGSGVPLCLTDAGRYGVHAMELVINAMLKRGADKRFIRAKAFGGSSLNLASEGSDGFFRVGEVNIRFIREFLENDGIPLVAADLGGSRARVIHFSSADYSVLVRKIRKPDQPKLVTRERQLWSRSIQEEEQRTPEPELWV